MLHSKSTDGSSGPIGSFAPMPRIPMIPRIASEIAIRPVSVISTAANWRTPAMLIAATITTMTATQKVVDPPSPKKSLSTIDGSAASAAPGKITIAM